MLYKLFLSLLVVSFSLTFSACSDDDTERKLTALQVTASQNPVPSGYQSQLTATAFYNDSTSNNTDASWESLDANIATVDFNSGLVSALSPGNVGILATTAEGTGEFQLSVTDATLQSIQLSPENSETPLGLNIQYTATGYFSDSSSRNINNEPNLQWESLDENVAVINQDTAKSETLSEGTTEFTAVFDNIVSSNTVLLTVNALAIQSITITPERVSWPLGLTQQFKAEALLSNGSSIDVSSDVTWDSNSPETVQLVDDSGVFQGILLGTSNISASLNSSIFSDNQALFIVESKELTSFTVSSQDGTGALPIGKKAQFKALAEFSDGEIYDVSGFKQVHWQSSAPSVATVTLSGEVTAVSLGLATISANTVYANASGQKLIQVNEAEIEAIVVQPIDQNRIISEAETQQYDAFARYTDSSIDEDVESEESFSWSVETHILGDPFTTPPEASIDESGLLTYDKTARFPGFAIVHGNYNGMDSQTSIQLPYAEQLFVSPPFPALEFIGVLTSSEADELDVEYSRVKYEDLGLNDYYEYVLMTFDQANMYCDTILYNGHNDWRLPSSAELVQLWQSEDGVDDVFVFSAGWVFGKNYWSATTQVSGHDTVSLVDASITAKSDSLLYYASCVRSQ